jgi:hypothetical protein
MFAACGLGGESQRKASWMSSIAISRAMPFSSFALPCVLQRGRVGEALTKNGAERPAA